MGNFSRLIAAFSTAFCSLCARPRLLDSPIYFRRDPLPRVVVGAPGDRRRLVARETARKEEVLHVCAPVVERLRIGRPQTPPEAHYALRPRSLDKRNGRKNIIMAPSTQLNGVGHATATTLSYHLLPSFERACHRFHFRPFCY